MLASLLPGLRELRAPLAAGYLWLAAGWLAFAGLIPRPEEARPGIFKDLYDVAAAAGPPAVAAAASFAAYVVGVLSVQATAAALPMLRVLRRRQIISRRLPLGVARPSAAGREELRGAVLDQLDQRYDKDPGLAEQLEQTRVGCGEPRLLDDRAVRRRLLDVRIDVDDYADGLERDLPLMPLRLLGEEKEHKIYAEFDRLRAEAEFRAAVALPLAAVVIVVAWRTSPLWLLAMVVSGLLVLEAGHNVTAAADVLAESIRAGASNSPVLGEVQAGELRQRKDWIKRAAENGYSGAMARLAARLETAGDTQGAQAWYRKAAEKGDSSAMFWLAGRLHLRHDPEAEQWYPKAAAAGDPDAMTIAALAAGSPAVSPAELADLKAAYAGDLAAMTRAGYRFERSGQTDKAEQWYRKAGEAGHGPARNAMAESLGRRGMFAAAAEWRRGTGDLTDRAKADRAEPEDGVEDEAAAAG